MSGARSEGDPPLPDGGVLADWGDNPVIGHATELLFDNFPVDAGIPNRYSVDSSSQFRHFVRKVDGEHNVYASLSDSTINGETLFSHTITYDLDSPIKTKEGIHHAATGVGPDVPEDKCFDTIFRNPTVAEDLIGEPLDDARLLVEASRDDGIPVFVVFTGCGFHVHQLFQRRKDPGDAMESTATKYIVENSIDTADPQVTGDSNRIVRVPNCHRVTESGRRCGVFTIPLTGDEVLDWDARRVVAEARQRRYPEGLPNLDESDRPQMEVIDEYVEVSSNGGYIEEVAGSQSHAAHMQEYDDWFIEEVENAVHPPCLRDAAFSKDPHHMARAAIAIELFNTGYSEEEAHKLIAELPWEDYDRRETANQLNQIWNKEYSSFSCEKLLRLGFCVHTEDLDECFQKDRTGGKALWRSENRKGLTRGDSGQ